MSMNRHVPVLRQEVLDALAIEPHHQIIDCTLGDAGHTQAILEQLGPKGKVLGIDADPEAILRAKQFLHQYADQTVFVRKNFVHLQDIVEEHAFSPVNGILLDLGWSTPQFQDRGRGFSFLQQEEPLDMRFSQQDGQLSASEVVMTYDEESLTRIFYLYGEEKLSRQIATAIVQKRQAHVIRTVGELVDIILQVYRQKLRSSKEVPWIGGLHPATKVFQALRIEVNNELGVLESVLPQALEVLAPKGRLAVISFHSLEDRIVKHYFKSQKDQVTIVTKKPIVCQKQEWDDNPPSRSAKLRVIEKI